MRKTLYVDSEVLKEKITSSGFKISFICEKLGISRQGFYKKLNGETPFRVPEVFVLCAMLDIGIDEREKIFYPDAQPISC